jgi:hypothetical protein
VVRKTWIEPTFRGSRRAIIDLRAVLPSAVNDFRAGLVASSHHFGEIKLLRRVVGEKKRNTVSKPLTDAWLVLVGSKEGFEALPEEGVAIVGSI